MPAISKSTRKDYAFACAVVMLALILRMFLFKDSLGAQAPFVLFYIAITAAAWHGGLWPGMLATVLSVLAVDYFFLPPAEQFFLPVDQLRIAGFILEGVLLSILCERLRETHLALEEKIYHLAQEITERERVEAALAKSEQNFRAIFELAAAGIVQTDPFTNRLLQVNKKFCDIVGYSKAELLEKQFTDITHPDDREPSLNGMAQMLNGAAATYTAEKRYIRKDGHIIWGLLYVTMLRDASGQPLRTIAIVQDITARKEAEEALKVANIRREEFLAILAHELRNPLSAVSNSVQLMLRAHASRQDMLLIMEQQIKYMIRLIDDLMDVTRISQGKIVLNKETLALADVIAGAVEITRDYFRNKTQTLTVRLPETPVYVDADRIRLTQACSNILTNASKYTGEKGEVIIEVKNHDKEVTIVIQDSGMGIPPDMLKQIFEMFTQVNNVLDRAQGGLGIGLALTRSMIVLHGGQIEAYSEGRNKGSRFTIRLPVVAVPAQAAMQPRDQESPSPRSHYRVLVVDDNDASARTMGWMLESFGHECQIAHDGPGGIKLAESFHPDVVLLDIGLPGMNGYDVCKALRQNPFFKNTIYIAQTGWGQPEQRALSQAAGFHYHLVKPIDLNALNLLFSNLRAATEQQQAA